MLLGVLLVILAGISWVVTGCIVSYCAHKKINYDVVQGLSALGTILFCGIIFLFLPSEQCNTKTLLIMLLFMMLGGLTNFFTFVLTAKAMAKGPNGLIWGILQSGMVGSFLLGVLCFGEKGSLLRWSGLIAIIAGILVMGLKPKKDEQQKEDLSWIWLSLGAMVLVAVTHCLITLPSFICKDGNQVSSVLRTMASLFGTFTGFAAVTMPGLICRHEKIAKPAWIISLVIVLQNGITSFLIFYPGIDILAKYGRGGLGYPIAIGVCVVGFSLYSLLFLREKLSKPELLGLIAVTGGILAISLG